MDRGVALPLLCKLVFLSPNAGLISTRNEQIPGLKWLSPISDPLQSARSRPKSKPSPIYERIFALSLLRPLPTSAPTSSGIATTTEQNVCSQRKYSSDGPLDPVWRVRSRPLQFAPLKARAHKFRRTPGRATWGLILNRSLRFGSPC